MELALQGTHKGPLQLPMGIIQATGNRINAPCRDVFRLKNGEIQPFNCYPSATVMLTQLGVLQNLEVEGLNIPDWLLARCQTPMRRLRT